jgi:hypothetical protein
MPARGQDPPCPPPNAHESPQQQAVQAHRDSQLLESEIVFQLELDSPAILRLFVLLNLKKNNHV